MIMFIWFIRQTGNLGDSMDIHLIVKLKSSYSAWPVSYTHLTLPTISLVEMWVGAGSLKKKMVGRVGG